MALFGGKNLENETKSRLAALEEKVELLAAAFLEQLNPGSMEARKRILRAYPDFARGQDISSGQAAPLEMPADSLVDEAGPHDSSAADSKADQGAPRALQDELAALRLKLREAERAGGELEKLRADLRRAKREKEKLQDDRMLLQSQTDELKKEQAALMRERQALWQREEQAERERREAENDYREAKRENERLAAELAAARGRQLREQAALLRIQDFLDRLSPAAKNLLRPYFNSDSMAAFLAQCGQFARLNQAWEAFGKAVTNGAAYGEAAKILYELLRLYNLSAGDSPAAALTAQPGDAYKAELHFRVRSDGTRVREQLLPGLRNAGGKLVQQALVTLE